MHKASQKWRYHSNIIIVNFVNDVIVDFSVYKHPYNNCCQLSFSLSEIRIHQSHCRPKPHMASLQLSPRLPIAGKNGPLRPRRGWNERRGKDYGRGYGKRREGKLSDEEREGRKKGQT